MAFVQSGITASRVRFEWPTSRMGMLLTARVVNCGIHDLPLKYIPTQFSSVAVTKAAAGHS